MKDLKIKANVKVGDAVPMKVEGDTVHLRIIRSKGLLRFGEGLAFAYPREKQE
ncbi:MAG: hypothetical protein ACE5KT_06605 [Methanosarcinales archaeon]